MFDLERAQDYDLLDLGIELIFQQNNKPIIFDEAQLSNDLFKALRF